MSSIRCFLMLLGVIVVNLECTSADLDDQPEFKNMILPIIIDCASEIVEQDDAKLTHLDHCMLTCVFEKIGVIKDGKFDKNGSFALGEKFLISDTEKEKINKITVECIKVNNIQLHDNDSCKIGRLLFTCISDMKKNLEI